MKDLNINKVVLAGTSLVLTDENNNVISETTVPDKATPNTDIQKIIVTIVANDKTVKITVDSGKTITADLLKEHIDLLEGYTIDGFYTDAQYTNEFNFDNTINTDTTIYAKISKVETSEPETNVPEVNEEEKDDTPQTGAENYLGIAILAMVVSAGSIFLIKKD